MEYIVIFMAWMLAGFVNNVAGFGAAMVAMPIIAIWSSVTGYSISVAVPSCTLIVLALNMQLAWSHREHITVRKIRSLILGGIVGTMVGVSVLHSLSETVLQAGMGIFLVIYSLWGWLTDEKINFTVHPNWGIVAGFFSTIFGIAFGFNGPPLIVYVAATKWPKEAVKGVLATAFIFSCLIILAGQISAGLQTFSTILIFLLALPGVLLGGLGGIIFSKNMGEKSYRKVIYGALICMGSSLVVTAF